MVTQLVRYKCDYCKKHFANKSYAKKHEEKCFYNPISKSCITCHYLHDESCNDMFENELINTGERYRIRKDCKLTTNCNKYINVDWEYLADEN